MTSAEFFAKAWRVAYDTVRESWGGSCKKELSTQIDWLFSVPAGTPLAGFGMSGEEDQEPKLST
jgi:hypothetical protein